MQNFISNSHNSDLKSRCYKFSLNTIDLTNHFPNQRSAWIIADQLIRSATSIGANIVEARAASSRLEFKKFFEIALKSANETQYWLGLSKDAKLARADVVDKLLSEAIEIGKILGSSVIKLKAK